MRSRLGPWIRTIHSIVLLPIWTARGRKPPLPPRLKSNLVVRLVKESGLRNFVETGTYRGDTLAAVAPHVDTAFSIELDRSLYDAACTRFTGRNVRLFHGDSTVVLPEVVRSLDAPTVFWLDGHFSGGVTAHGPTTTPIESELRCLLAERDAHLILIDDARLFGTSGYPSLDVIKDLVVSIRPNATWDMRDDIVRIRLDQRQS